jgi:hypothetical protein
MIRKLQLALLVATCAVAFTALVQPASAYWRASGSGTGTAPVSTMPAGITPTTAVAGTTVTLTITQGTVQGNRIGAIGGSYSVLRYPAAGGSGVTPTAGTCATPVTGTTATLTCTETSTPPGDWKYTIKPTLFQWTGAESALSAATAVAPPAPTGAVATLAPAAKMTISWTAASGATGYNVYRRTSAGAYNFATPLNGATPVSGTTYSDTTSVSGTAYLYVVRSVVIGGAGQQIESVNSNETTSATADGTVPTGVTITDPGSPLDGTVTLSGAATDTLSGIANVKLQYKLSSGSTWTDVCTDTTTPYSCSLDTTTVADGLYDLRALATDNAGNQTASASVVNRRIDNTVPTVTPTNPGTYVRGNITLGGTATDAGSGIASLVLEGRAIGAGAWVTVCTSTTSPLTCTYDTTTIADGAYEVRLTATDAAGNQTISPIVTPINVDNTAPTGTDIQTANKAGGTAGRPEVGDTITYTFSEPMKATAILAGWSGASTNVTARFNQAGTDTVTIFNAGNTAQLPLGSFTIGTAYITANMTFTNSTMVMTGNTITITLGTTTGTPVTSAANVAMTWSPSATATDLAGNPMSTANVNETGAADREF